jgi:hypothetical protein
MYYIYALEDPRDNRYFYVGQTSNPERRYKQHIRHVDNCNPQKDAWVDEIVGAGLQPVMVILEQVSFQEVNDREWWHILSGIRRGWPLTNIVLGPAFWKRKPLVGVEFLYFKRHLLQLFRGMFSHTVKLETFSMFLDIYRIDPAKKGYLLQLAENTLKDYYFDMTHSEYGNYIEHKAELLLEEEKLVGSSG